MKGFKIVCVGDVSVGQSTFVNKFQDPQFSDDEQPWRRIKEAFAHHQMSINGRLSGVDLWPTQCHDDYDRLRPSTYSGADAFIVMYSVADPSSFANVDKWVAEVKSHTSQDIPIVLVSTKTEFYGDRATIDRLAEKNMAMITKQQGEQKASDIGASFIESSTVYGRGINEAVREAARLADDKAQHPSASNVAPKGGAKQAAGKTAGCSCVMM